MGPSREACDRCHSMKTRCVRAPQSQVCLRCNRLGISCNYSPPGRTGRPLGSRRSRTASTHGSESTQAGNDMKFAPFPTTTDSSDLSNLITSGPPTSGLDDMEFFTSSTVPDDDAISFSFIDSLSSASSNSMAVSAALEPHFDPSRLQSSTSSRDQSLVNLSDGELDMSPLQDTDIPDDDDHLHSLLDIQSRLAKLIKSLSKGPSAPEAMEDTYRASETLLGILNSIEEQPQPRPPMTSPKHNGAFVLLLSSCYFSLIHAYELLAGLLRDEVGRGPQLMSSGQLTTAPTSNIQSQSSQSGMPCISVGAVRLAMPRKAVAQINMHLITQMVQHLKDSMHRFATRAASAQRSQSVGSEQRRGTWGSLEKTQECNTINNLAATAQNELRRREESLLTHLRTTMSLVESGAEDMKI